MPTLEIEDEVPGQLRPYQSDVNAILKLGIRQWQDREEPGYAGIDDILQKLATLPSPEEVLAFRPSPGFQNRMDELMEKNRKTGFTADEQREWDGYEYAEHLVRMAKIHATIKLKRSASRVSPCVIGVLNHPS